MATANIVQAFIDEALSHRGEDGTFAYAHSGLTAPQAFCAAFIVSCGTVVGARFGKSVIGNIILYSWGAYNIAVGSSLAGAIANPGVFTLGPMNGNVAVPSAGDIILYKFPSNFHVGIVRGCYNGIVYTMEGNVGFDVGGGNYVSHMCDTREQAINNPTIYGYFHPRWDLIGGNCNAVKSVAMNIPTSSNALYSTTSTPTTVQVSNQQTPTVVTPATKPSAKTVKVEEPVVVKLDPAELISKSLYTTESTKEDAIVREVCYIDSNGNKSKYGKIKLSVINYTQGLSALLRVRDSSIYYFEDLKFDTDLLKTPQSKIVLRYLFDKGFNAPQAIGIHTVIYKLSEFDPSFMDKDNGKYGIMGWNKKNIEKVIKSCGSNWSNNITGQMDYIWIDMTTNRKNYISSMENEVLENKKSYLEESLKLTLKEYVPGYSQSFYKSCKLIASQTWEILLGN